MASKIFRPRRGLYSPAASKKLLLAKGELFVEVPDTGVGTGQCKIKMGDGTTTYESLPYAIDLTAVETNSSVVTLTLPDSSASDSDILDSIASGATVAELFGAIKTLLESLTTTVASKADKAHASTATTYGVGTSSKYGHLKITDTYSNPSATTNGYTAVSTYAIQQLLNNTIQIES